MTMRQIKFKGKSLATGKWLYGDLIQALDADRKAIVPQNQTSVNYEDYEVEPITVGQFTGLYDKEGNEIYQGDFVELPDDDEVSKFLVVWSYAEFCLQAVNNRGVYQHDILHHFITNDEPFITVLGNRFDDP